MAGNIDQVNRKIEYRLALEGDHRFVIQLLRQNQRFPVETAQEPEDAAFRQTVLGQREVDAQ